MKSILEKISIVAAAAVALTVGGAMAGLGLTLLAFMAVIGFASFGVALLVLPFINPARMQEKFEEMNRFRSEAPVS